MSLPLPALGFGAISYFTPFRIGSFKTNPGAISYIKKFVVVVVVVEVLELVEAVESGEPVELVESVESGKGVESDESVDSVELLEPVKTTEKILHSQIMYRPQFIGRIYKIPVAGTAAAPPGTGTTGSVIVNPFGTSNVGGLGRSIGVGSTA